MNWKPFDHTTDLEALEKNKYYLFYMQTRKKCKAYVGYKDIKYNTITFIIPNVEEMCGVYELINITHYMEIQEP